MQMVGITSGRISASMFSFICITLTAFTLLWLSICRFMFSSQAQNPCQDFPDATVPEISSLVAKGQESSTEVSEVGELASGRLNQVCV